MREERILIILQKQEKIPGMTKEEVATLIVLVITIAGVVSFVVGTQILLGSGTPQKREFAGSVSGSGDDRPYTSNAYPYQFSYPNSHYSGP
jgi:hypothetical protein